MTIRPIDLHHDGLPRAICTYLIPEPEPALVDPGPATTLDTLREELEDLGSGPEEIRHVFLTHVHLDHAGATGHLGRENPRLRVHVHEDGARHMADPERLVASTRRTFGEAHDRLWGEVVPVPADRIRPWEPGESPRRGALRFVHSPGHIDHHVAYLHEESGTLLAGDSAGIILHPEAPTHPPTPPPGVDLAAWRTTLSRLRELGAERVAVTHFGPHGEAEDRLLQLEARLESLEARVERALTDGDSDAAEEYEEDVRREQGEYRPREEVDRYFDTFRAATDWAGARRYVERRRA